MSNARARRALPIAALCLLLVAAAPLRSARDETLRDAALAFLESLSREARERARLPYDAPERRTWSYFPGQRAGLRLGEIDAAQREQLERLIDAAFSSAGAAKARDVIELEAILRELEGGRASRDPAAYTVALFGDPRAGRWAFRIEGHHLSMRVDAEGAQALSGAPAFLGAHPHRVSGGARAGWAPLAAEESLGRDLLASLGDEQRERARLPAPLPREIALGPDTSAIPEWTAGVAAEELAEEPRARLRELIAAYAGRMREGLAQAALGRIDAAGFGSVRFAWAGDGSPAEAGRLVYYRVHGPTFALEYCDVEGGSNHVHTVWREAQGELGPAVPSAGK